MNKSLFSSSDDSEFNSDEGKEVIIVNEPTDINSNEQGNEMEENDESSNN